MKLSRHIKIAEISIDGKVVGIVYAAVVCCLLS